MLWNEQFKGSENGKAACRKFAHDIKVRAVDDYVSGRKSAAQVAAELETSVGQIYSWRVQLEEKAKGAKIDELESTDRSRDDALFILQLKKERDAYQRTVGEQTVIIELLKKTAEIDELTTAERIDWVDRNFRTVGLKQKARQVMELAEGTYYSDPKVTRKKRDEVDADIRGKVEQIRAEFPRTGYRVLLAHLKRWNQDWRAKVAKNFEEVQFAVQG